jgi:hypothetical protein
MSRRHLRLVAFIGVLMVTAALTGCGRADADPLSRTEAAMAALDEGHIEFALAATADSGAKRPVGFRMRGPFAIQNDRRYPTLDMRYTTLLGDSETDIRIVSDGHALHLVQDGAKTEVSPQQARFLRLGKGDRGFTDLGVSGWVDDAAVVDRPDGSRLVTGSIDVGDLLSDLARISGQAAGAGTGETLDAGSARRLQRLVRSSEFTAELDRAGLPRNLRAVVDFGRELPAELRAALGPYASPRLEVTLAVEPTAH